MLVFVAFDHYSMREAIYKDVRTSARTATQSTVEAQL